MRKIFFSIILCITTTRIIANENEINIFIHELKKTHEEVHHTGWTLIWHDEFKTSSLNELNWSKIPQGKSDWNKNMSEKEGLITLENGTLILKGISIKDDITGLNKYYTAGITSHKKFSFKYGKIEIRARFKSARGAWPALWMLGVNGNWPANGEIDIMEHLNFDDEIYQTVHSNYTINLTPHQKKEFQNYKKTKIDKDSWNIYGCEWDQESIKFTVNNQTSHIYNKIKTEDKIQWPFNQPFYILISMQIGGQWVNSYAETNSNDYPANIEIDWVRVYKKPLIENQLEIFE